MGHSIMFVEQEIADERLKICKNCPQLSTASICKICNCVMPIKTKLAFAACPLNLWSAQK